MNIFWFSKELVSQVGPISVHIAVASTGPSLVLFKWSRQLSVIPWLIKSCCSFKLVRSWTCRPCQTYEVKCFSGAGLDIFIIDVLVMFSKFALKYQRNFPLSRQAHWLVWSFSLWLCKSLTFRSSRVNRRHIVRCLPAFYQVSVTFFFCVYALFSPFPFSFLCVFSSGEDKWQMWERSPLNLTVRRSTPLPCVHADPFKSAILKQYKCTHKVF